MNSQICVNTPYNQYILKQLTPVVDNIDITINLWVESFDDGEWITVSHFTVDNKIIVSILETLADLERGEDNDRE